MNSCMREFFFFLQSRTEYANKREYGNRPEYSGTVKQMVPSRSCFHGETRFDLPVAEVACIRPLSFNYSEQGRELGVMMTPRTTRFQHL